MGNAVVKGCQPPLGSAHIYADNANHFGTCMRAVGQEMELVDMELNRVGLATHKVTEASLLRGSLGALVDGTGMEVAPLDHRVRKPVSGLLRLFPLPGRNLNMLALLVIVTPLLESPAIRDRGCDPTLCVSCIGCGGPLAHGPDVWMQRLGVMPSLVRTSV